MFFGVFLFSGDSLLSESYLINVAITVRLRVPLGSLALKCRWNRDFVWFLFLCLLLHLCLLFIPLTVFSRRHTEMSLEGG